MEIVSFQSGQVSPGIKYYTVDTEADKNTIPIGKMGNRCYVIESKKWYILNSNGEWVPFAAEGGAVDTDAILSAVENMTDAQRSQFISDLGFGTVFTFMGSVASQSDLPNSNNKVGYVYYVELDSSEYVWVVNQSQPNGYWEELGETFDVTVDSELSNTSENPVQNKTIALALNELHGSMDDMAEMLDSMIMLRTELTVDTTQDAWSGANWNELIAAAKNGRAVSLGVDGADAQTVLLHYDELANSAEIKIIETEPKVYYYSTLAGAVSDSNAGTVGTNADASQGTAVVSLYVDENGVPVMTMTQNAAISAGLLFTRDAIFNLNGKKLTANLGNPESYVYAVAVSNGKRLRIIGEATGSAIEAVTGTGTAVYMIYCGIESYLEILGGAYAANAENTNLGIGVMSFGDILIRGATISATAKQVRGVAVGSAVDSHSYRPNTIIANTEIIVTGSGENNKYGVDVRFANETLIDGCTIAADTDAEVGGTYGIYLGDITGSTIIRNTEVTADSSYETDGSGGYVVLSTGVCVSADCTYTLLDGVTAKGTHTAASLYSTTDIVGGSYSSAGHGVYFSGSSTAHRVKGAEMDDLYVGTHTNTNQNHVGAYIGGSSGATGISVYADDTDVSGSNYSWVLRNSSGEHDNALYISNSNINNKTIRIDDTTTLRLYLGDGNSFDANDTTRPANVVETGADYTFSPTVTTISYIGQPVTGSLTERDPGSVTIREISLKSSGGAVVTDYALVQSAAVSAAISTAVAGKANTADLATVATSGSYNDLSNKPTIPSLSGYATETWVTNKGYQTAAQVQTAISSGSVTSVNGQTGAVVLSASDVGAAAAGAVYTKEEIEQKLVGAMTYRGTKAAISDLPVTGNTIGDVWHITADGAEWAWDGSEWQNLGTVVDISGKADKSAFDAHTGNTTIHVTAADKTAWNGKQDAISDLATIRSGAAAGATAVQPGSLATVATSGSYNDLSNKPTIPTVPTNEISANTAARHTHSNKSLLDTYTQTEVNLADAVSKKHTHNNKTVLDGITAAKLLPTVTTSDNDKFLRVVSGAWAAATVPSAETASF